MEYPKPAQPPPAIVISAETLGSQFGLGRDKIDSVVEARRLAVLKIDQYVSGLNVGNKESSPGYFTADKELLYKVDRNSTLNAAVTEALKLPDPRLLTPGMVDGLIQANSKSHPEVAAKLTELRDSLVKGGPAISIPAGTQISVKSGESLRYEMLQNQALMDMLSALPESLLSDNGRKNRAEILILTGRIGVHKEAQALGLEIERDNSVLKLRAEEGTLKIIEGLNPRLETLENVLQRAQKLNMPEPQLKSIQNITAKAREQSIETAIDVSQRAAQIYEMRGDGTQAMRYLASIKGILPLIADPARREAELTESSEQARLLISRTVSAQLVRGTDVATFRKTVEGFFSGPEADVVMAQSLLRAASLNRNQQLLKGIDDSKDPFSKNCYTQAAEAYSKALTGLGYGAAPRDLTRQERLLAYEASNYLIERALTEGKISDVSPLLEYRKSGIKGAQIDEVRRHDDALKVRLARAVFEAPKKYGNDVTSFLGLANPDNEKETRVELLGFVKTRLNSLISDQKALADRNAPVSEQRALSQEVSDTQVALSRMLVHGVVSLRGSASEKMDYYRQLDDLNNSVLKGEKEIIAGLRTDLANLEKLKASDAQQSGLVKDRIEVLKGEIQARELSAAMIIVQQAEVALHGNHPDLTREARKLIESAEEFGGAHPGIAKLTRTFREQHEHGKLRAAVEEFLSEVNKDYPPYVLGAMIAAGILGAAAGYGTWKNNKGALYGFMAASCLTLGATKLYYGLQGMDQVQAAYQTGFSPHSPTQDFLNVLYLGADLVQALPLIPAALGLWALSRMKGRDDIIKEVVQADDPEKAKSYLSQALHLLGRAGAEGIEFGKAVLSLANPKTATFWLLTATIGTASYQVLGSDLPDPIKNEQMAKLGLELMQTLAIAIIYDRIAANLADEKKKNPREAARDAVDTLNNGVLPEPSPGPEQKGESNVSENDPGSQPA